MYLLTACTMSWLCLLAAFVTTWTALPTPRSTTDLAVIIVVGTATVLFSRLGLVSLLTLLIRLLPDGRVKTRVTRTVLRIVPALLRSSVLAAASASLAVHAAQASPLPPGDLIGADHVAATSAAVSGPDSATRTEPALDPGWPLAVPDDPPPSDLLPDPGWPSTPPAEEHAPDPVPAPSKDDKRDTGSGDEDSTVEDTGSGGKEAQTHIVGSGESLWSIAANRSSSGEAIHDIVDEIYSANREVIGVNPNLIMPGQRLEIQP